ncbi:hypothetical protein JB92DRAFT_2820030 [Gautieria morchelliformis]|nr:hypothetical protein JB92DRAFT_2820030 [Gautieria morchelliformis]
MHCPRQAPPQPSIYSLRAGLSCYNNHQLDVMAELGLAASVIAVLQITSATIMTCFNYGNSVKNASKDKKKLRDRLMGLQGVLAEVEELVELVDQDTSLRLPTDDETNASRLPTLSKLLKDPDGLPRCQAEIETLHKKLEANRRMQALIWPFKEGETRKSFEYLGQFQQVLSAALNADQTRLTWGIHTGVETVRTGVEELQKEVAVARLRDQRHKIHDWIWSPENHSKHTNVCKERQAATGTWFLEGEDFREWTTMANSFLWLHGIPGAGKTVLCSTIIEDVSRRCQSDPSVAFVYFYFDFRSSDTRPNDALRSSIKQLSLRRAAIPVALAKLFEANKEGQRAPTPEQLMATLKAIIGTFQNVYIIFDALDECPQRDELLTMLREIHGWGLDTIHMLASSRRERDIEETLDTLVSHQIPMDACLVDDDIRTHVCKTLDHDIKFRRCSPEEKQLIESTLINGAHGMFRWAVCQLDALRNCFSPTELRKALKSLPRTLNETYDRILSAIHEERRRDALRMLQWLAFAVRPISLEEAVEVLATDPDAEDGPLFDPGRRPWDSRNIVTICSSLVTIVVTEVKVHRDGDGMNQDREASSLRLAHFSVREYLTSEHLQKNPKLSYYHFNRRVADRYIAKTCLAYLLQFSEHNCVSSTTRRTYPLSDYAARQWMDHAQSDADGESDSLHRLVMALFQPRDAMYKNWLQLYNLDPNPDPDLPDLPDLLVSDTDSDPDPDPLLVTPDNPKKIFPSPLYYSSFAGLERTCQDLLRSGLDVNAQEDKEYGTALQVAAYKGHEGVVRLLLDNGADAGVTPSRVAPSWRHYRIWIWLEPRASDGRKGVHFGTALQAATCAGHERIVRLLLDKGADINARGGVIFTLRCTWRHI